MHYLIFPLSFPMTKKLLKIGRIKTVDLNQLDWFDRQNGNSYFAAEITINFGMKSEKTITLPYQYGYGSHCENVASRLFDWKKSDYAYIGSNCREHGITFRHNRRDAKKSELREIG